MSYTRRGGSQLESILAKESRLVSVKAVHDVSRLIFLWSYSQFRNVYECIPLSPHPFRQLHA